MHTDDVREQGFERALRQSLARPATLPRGDCVDAETLAAWSDGTLAPAQAASVELHLSSCPSCQALMAAFARTTPAARAAVPLWRRWQLQWLVPLATATAALTIYLTIPGRTPAQGTPMREVGAAAQLTAPASPPVPSEPREQSARFAAPSGSTTPPSGLPPEGAARAVTPQPTQLRAKASDALASAQEELKKETDALARVAEADVRARAAAEERRSDASRDIPAAAKPAAAEPAAPPPATAAAAAPAAAAPVPLPGRQEQIAGALGQARALNEVASIEVTSPTSATRWRIALGGPVDYFGKSAPTGRPTDIPAPTPITTGSSPQDDVCWMVGRGGAVYLTIDGTHFTRIAFPDVVDLVAVRATDANAATVTSATGRTYRTMDAGKSWQQQ